MKVKIKKEVEVEVEIKTLHVRAGVRYWEDATVDGIEDTDGKLIPCRVEDEDDWFPVIEIEKGRIINWHFGKTADIHYKVCEDGDYYILDEKDNEVIHLNGYVPKTLCPEENGYGDYIIMKVNEEGFINNWKFDVDDFLDDND